MEMMADISKFVGCVIAGYISTYLHQKISNTWESSYLVGATHNVLAFCKV